MSPKEQREVWAHIFPSLGKVKHREAGDPPKHSTLPAWFLMIEDVFAIGLMIASLVFVLGLVGLVAFLVLKSLL